MKNLLRKWLGINEDVQAIASDMNMLLERSEETSLYLFEMFHAMPFSAIVLGITAKDARQLTQPGGPAANSLNAILMGVVSRARQGNSYLQLQGELEETVKDTLIKRGFTVTEENGTTNILWT
jgi:hypothetical protein